MDILIYTSFHTHVKMSLWSIRVKLTSQRVCIIKLFTDNFDYFCKGKIESLSSYYLHFSDYSEIEHLSKFYKDFMSTVSLDIQLQFSPLWTNSPVF